MLWDTYTNYINIHLSGIIIHNPYLTFLSLSHGGGTNKTHFLLFLFILMTVKWHKWISVFLMIKWSPHIQFEINSMYRHCMGLLPTHSLAHMLRKPADKTGRIQCSCKEAKGEIYWSGSWLPAITHIEWDKSVLCQPFVPHSSCFWSWRSTWVMENV